METTQPTTDAETYYKQGLARVKLRQYDDAIVDYDMAIQLKPDYAIAYISRGNAKFYLGQYAAATTDFDNAIQLKPDDADAYVARGTANGL